MPKDLSVITSVKSINRQFMQCLLYAFAITLFLCLSSMSILLYKLAHDAAAHYGISPQIIYSDLKPVIGIFALQSLALLCGALILAFSMIAYKGRNLIIKPYITLTELSSKLLKAKHDARLMQAAIANAKDSIYITTAELDHAEIIYVNAATSKISGYTQDEILGQTPAVLHGEDLTRKTIQDIKDTLAKGLAYTGEVKAKSKQGQAYWVDVNIVPIKDEDGRITHFAAIERDITPRKIFEKQLEITKEAAEVANRAKGDFLANMSHELRTPMNGIIGLSELLIDISQDEESGELAEAVNTSARNLLILLNDILDLSKIEAGELTLENIPYDLHRAVKQTTDLLRPIASRKSVILDLTIAPDVPDMVMGDPTRLQQIISNLISNAIKFTDVGYVRTHIEMAETKNDAPEILIRVEDTGIGIAEDKQDRIFQKFTQADVSTNRKYGGTGLGLAITKELVDIMHGDISLESEEGSGTVFHVRLPIETTRKKQAAQTHNAAQKLSFNKSAKILVVDDHPINLLFMRKVLTKMGFAHADEAQSGKQAIELVDQNSYDLIFMDCQMPEIDGFEASTIIREKEAHIGDIKIIAVTADAMKGAREKCLDAGMNDYISKPVDIEKLSAILCHWLPDSAEDSAAPAAKPQDTPAQDMPPARQDNVPAIMDWTRLDMFADGDPAEMNALIDMFINYSQETISTLREHYANRNETEWKKAAHKLKGSAANLGAQMLSLSCRDAEQGYQAPLQEKKLYLDNILFAYDQVITTLEARRA